MKGLPPELGTLLGSRCRPPACRSPRTPWRFPAATDNVSVTVEIAQARWRSRRRATSASTRSTWRSCRSSRRAHARPDAGHPQLTLTPELADSVVAEGLRLSHRLTLRAGQYQLRIGVREIGGGAAGSVLCDLVVPDPAVPGLAMTPIVASASSAITVPSAYNDPGLLWALGGPPTTARAFDRTDTLSAYVELVDAGATAIRDVDILTVVRDAPSRRSSAACSPRPTAGSRRTQLRRRRPAAEGARAGRYALRIEPVPATSEPLARELTFDVRSRP